MKNTQHIDLNKAAAEILVSKRNKVATDILDMNGSDTYGDNVKTALVMQVNFESLGYSFAPEMLAALSHEDNAKLTGVYDWLQNYLKRSVGAHQMFNPMYPNFPKQVMEASDFELMFNALMHYTGDWFGVRILPQYQKNTRLPLLDEIKPKMLTRGNEGDIKQLFIDLMNSNTSLSDNDKNNVRTLFAFYHARGEVADILQSGVVVIPQKENLAIVANLVLQNKLPFVELMADKFKTTTDVLRLATEISGGDVSLAAPTKFKNFNRPQRKALLSLVDQVLATSSDKDQAVENMFGYREQWLRIAERTYPNEYAKRFAHAANVFDILRKDNKPQSFNSKVEASFANNDLHGAMEQLATRPGVFARQLNRLLQKVEGNPSISLRKVNKTIKAGGKYTVPAALQAKLSLDPASKNIDFNMVNEVLTAFYGVSEKISTPVLLQVKNYFAQQAQIKTRSFFPKGIISKAQVVNNYVAPLHSATCEKVVDICEQALVNRFQELPSLGKVYIDPSLKEQNTPFAMRSASKSLQTVARGSQLPTEDSDTMRLFLWWNESYTDKNGNKASIGRVDIDLSAVVLDENYQYVKHCSFTNLRDGGLYHSGDITSAPNGACEFIDVKKSELQDGQYVAMVITSYTEQNYCDLPECYAGWMERKEPHSGEIFDPRTVKNKIDLASESGCVMPMVYDMKNNAVIWTDLSLKAADSWRAVERNSKTIAMMTRSMAELSKPTLFDLFTLHAKARGVIVDNKDEADTVFSLHEGVTPFMYETIAADFMADAAPQKPAAKKKM